MWYEGTGQPDLLTLISRVQTRRESGAHDVPLSYGRPPSQPGAVCFHGQSLRGSGKAPQQWTDLFTAVIAEMEAGTDPADPKAQKLAKRWLALATVRTGGDPGIFNSLRRVYENEENVIGTDTKAPRPKMEYI